MSGGPEGTIPLPEVTPAVTPAWCFARAGSQQRCSLGTALWLQAGKHWLCPPGPSAVIGAVSGCLVATIPEPC